MPWPAARSPKILPLQGLAASLSDQNSEGLKARPLPGAGVYSRKGHSLTLWTTYPGAEPSSTGATREPGTPALASRCHWLLQLHVLGGWGGVAEP